MISVKTSSEKRFWRFMERNPFLWRLGDAEMETALHDRENFSTDLLLDQFANPSNGSWWIVESH
jgi:hypothetical protein